MGAAVLWGLIGPFSVWAAREGLSATETAFWRTALSAPAFALLAVFRRQWPAPRDLAGVAGFGVVGIAVMYGAFFIAVQRVGVGIAAVLLYTGPAWVGVFQWAATRRPPGRTSQVALLLTIGGVVLVSLDPANMGSFDRAGIAAGLV
jgi:drug/metabolite transporter (DMT)-like permease